MRTLRMQALLLATALAATPTFAAQDGAARPDWASDAPVDAPGSDGGPYATMEMLYERTLFRVDVLHLTLAFGSEAAERLERLAAGRAYDRALGAEVTATALGASDVLVRSHFLRHITLRQYLDGVRDNLRHALAGGLLTRAEQADILAGIETRYAPLRERGIRDGETVWYRIRGDEVEIVFQAADGSLFLRLRADGAAHRRAILGGYLAPASEFREPLVRSLFRTAVP